MKRLRWNDLDAAAQRDALARPTYVRSAELGNDVRRVIAQVRADGDHTLRALSRRFDGVELSDFRVDAAEFEAADRALGPELRNAIDAAYTRIGAFHRATAPMAATVETAPGVRCERVLRPISRVGLYVPAGTAPLPSTALMLGVPAQLAGCPGVEVCTPPRKDGTADPSVLSAVRRCGITRVFKLGGAQAIAAMAYGTETVPKCDKLFGPGNPWVTEAKMQVANDPMGAAIDMQAGPSELLVIADAKANAVFAAADLLSQAEHGVDSQVLLLSDSADMIDRVVAELQRQLQSLPRREIAEQALTNSRAILVRDIDQAVEVSNAYAPEHLILQIDNARRWLSRVKSAGSVFLGPWSPEAVGDYCSGTNHVLPTYGAARAISGLSVSSFLKQITVQELTTDGLRAIGDCAMTLARAEGLTAHERAVSIRLDALRKSGS